MTPGKPRSVVPDLRFPEFRGDDDWMRDQIGDFASISKGKGISKKDTGLGGATPCIRYAELYTLYGEVIREVVSLTNVPHEDLVLSQTGDVIVPASGETRSDIVKAACVLPESVALGSDLNILRSDLYGPFFSYLLNSPLRHTIARMAQGDTVAHLYPRQLSQVWMAYPSRIEQQKIADCLGSLDDLIAAEVRKLEALRQHKKGLMQQMFPQPGETVPRLRFPEYRNTEQWATRKFGRVVSRSKEAFVPDNTCDTPHLIELAKIESKTGRVLDVSQVDNQKSLKSRFQAGDVLFGKLRPYLRKFARPDFPGVCTSEIWVLRGKEISSAFLFYLVQTERFIQLANVSSGSRMPRAEWSFLAGSDFKIPGPDEQKKIAHCLGSLDDLITAKGRKLEALRQHKQGLMQQMFPTLETC